MKLARAKLSVAIGLLLTNFTAIHTYAGPPTKEQLQELCERKSGNFETLHQKSGDLDAKIHTCQIEYARIGAHSLYRGTKGLKTKAVQAFLTRDPRNDERRPLGLAHPAKGTCKKMGGIIINYEGQHGTTGMCQFSDNSSIAQWTLHQGPKNHPALYQIVRNY